MVRMTALRRSLFGHSTTETLFLQLVKQRLISVHRSLVKKLHEPAEWVCTVFLSIRSNLK